MSGLISQFLTSGHRDIAHYKFLTGENLAMIGWHLHQRPIVVCLWHALPGGVRGHAPSRRCIFPDFKGPIDSWSFLLAKNAFLDILVVLRLHLGWISFNMVESAFATWQLALLVTRIAFHNILARTCAEIKFWDFIWTRRWPTCTTLGFSIFEFFSPFLFLLSFSFCCSDWPSTRLACD